MKKLAIILALLCIALTSVFATDGSVVWNWYRNDRNVKYYRYQLDAEEEDGWTVVDGNTYEVYLDVDVSVSHILYLQQSYDGIHWSESTSTESEPYVEEEYYYEDEDFFYDDEFYDEIPEEEVVVEEEVEQEVAPVVVQENKDLGFSFVNFSFAYRNSIPYHAVSRDLGFVASYTHLFPFSVSSSATFSSGLRGELGFYAAEEIFSSPSNTDYFLVAAFQGAVNFAPDRGDFTLCFGPEFQLKFGASEPVCYYGFNALLGLRFTLTEKYSLGFSIADHFYFYPEKLNLYDIRVTFSLTV